MKTCPYSGLPITAKPHWKEEQPGYLKRIELVGNDIFHAFIESRHPVMLQNLSNNLVKTVLRESKIPDQPLYLVWDMSNINDISYDYKQGINDLIYHWGPSFSVVVFYNIDPSCQILIESFAAIAPNSMTVLLRTNYRDAIETIMAYRTGKAHTEELEAPPDDEEIVLKKEFLAAVARISWLNMLNHKVFLPPAGNRFYPYFKALEHMQCDLQSREELHEKEMLRLKNDYEQRITQKIILLNAQIELNRKELLQHEQERASLKSRISSQEMELTRISTAIGEKTTALHQLHEQIRSLDIDLPVKQRMIDQCQNMLETELTEKRLKTELTAGDSEFLSKLQKKHPNLNQRELRVGLMVKLNYDTREVARSIGISTRGMESIRYRMHKKLNLDKHKSIKTYLSELAAEQ
ncbi:MAG: transcriptional regulator [Chlorobiaceae bacterium]|nr:transcriptional regulator [Chlorobiaceae bacterium]NTW73863.1 transcriptional regulator [Chlorobiaceae bacterium]